MATFTRSDNLQGAEFVDANLRGARFPRADLSGVVRAPRTPQQSEPFPRLTRPVIGRKHRWWDSLVSLHRIIRTCRLTWPLGRQEMAAAGEDAYCWRRIGSAAVRGVAAEAR
jgi:hypothetical protein